MSTPVAVLMGSGSADPCSGDDGGDHVTSAGREESIYTRGIDRPSCYSAIVSTDQVY